RDRDLRGRQRGREGEGGGRDRIRDWPGRGDSRRTVGIASVEGIRRRRLSREESALRHDGAVRLRARTGLDRSSLYKIRRMRRLLTLTLVLGCAYGQHQHESTKASRTTLLQGLGRHHHPIATKSAEAQKFFDEGL